MDAAKQRDFAIETTRRLRAAGFEAYWAGGCVRDQLLGRMAKDYDIATDALPEQIRDVFGRRRTLAIGAAFGVVTVLGPRGAGQIEVATFRRDDSYSDGRHPDQVTFTTAQEDAARRDFTINGLFYDPLNDEVIDFVGGRDDLQKCIVRAIGDPAARFSEDKLRMLRAVRFTANLEFTLDPATREAIVQMAPEISVVSAERIAAEMRTMLCDTRRGQALALLSDTGLWAAILPGELQLPVESAGRQTLELLDHLETNSFAAALATSLLLSVDADQAAAIGRHWKLSNAEIERTAWLVRNCRALDRAAQQYWPTVQRILVHDGSRELLAILRARVATGQADQADLDFVQERLSWPADRLNPPPLISGDDLIQHGLPPGKPFRSLLHKARDAQLLGQLTSRDQALEFVDRLVDQPEQ
ncbi:MAG: CCA tRNA nucleotidyltransferase [Planctomycetota bacterium]|nr:CCA tRNA nucleotidyltransferase [Planctomycetota bacterium]